MSGANVLLLPGPDGSNPLGFLAALGLLRTLSREPDLAPVALRWVAAEGWRPEFTIGCPLTPKELVDRVQTRLSGTADRPEFTRLGKNLTASRDEFHRFLRWVRRPHWARRHRPTSVPPSAAMPSRATKGEWSTQRGARWPGQGISTFWRRCAI